MQGPEYYGGHVTSLVNVNTEEQVEETLRNELGDRLVGNFLDGAVEGAAACDSKGVP